MTHPILYCNLRSIYIGDLIIASEKYGIYLTIFGVITVLRSTPVETLHTVLLGPYKYLLRSLMGRLSTKQKNEIQARVTNFDLCGIDYKLTYNLCRHFRSFIGRDFKALAQVALYLLTPYMTSVEEKVCLSLSKVSGLFVLLYWSLMLGNVFQLILIQVFKLVYCQPFMQANYDEYKEVCEKFVSAVHEHCPELRKKVKVHMILHLPENVKDFGPTSAFNTER